MSGASARTRRVALMAAAGLAGCAPSPASQPLPGEAPQRIVSIDYCADQMVLGLVEAGRIGAVSREVAADPLFALPLARDLPRTDANVERLLALQPDLVVRSYGGSPRLDAVLARAGVPVLALPHGETPAAVAALMRQAGERLGAQDRAAQLTRGMQAQLAGSGQPAVRPTALYTTPGSYTAGAGTMVDHLLRAAGLANMETRAGWHRLPLEDLVRSPPQLVIHAFGESAMHRAEYASSSRHRALLGTLRNSAQVHLPGSEVACNNWRIGQAVVRLRRAARNAAPAQARQ